MKFVLIVDSEKQPSVTVVCNKVTRAVQKIEEICNQADGELIYGYQADEIIPLALADITCFFTKDNKVYARVEEREYVVKLRIKQIVELIDDSFIKINQGCIVKVNAIKRFTASIGGSLQITLKDGYTDYVARREIRNIKRRLGL